MNQRIRELVRQAGLDDVDFPIENWDNVPLARFAELIVKECAELASRRIVDNHTVNRSEYNDEVAKKIKQHFGVN